MGEYTKGQMAMEKELVEKY